MRRGGKTQWLSNEVEQACLEDGAIMGPEKVAVEWAVKGWRRKRGQCRWSDSQHSIWITETSVGRL